MTDLSADDSELAEYLTDRFVERFLSRWPETDFTPEEVRHSLSVARGELDGDLALVLTFGITGSVTSSGWDGTRVGAEEIVDGDADAKAYDAESDRWINRGGWREYRP